MRKVWLVFSMVLFGLMLAVPAYAAVPYRNNYQVWFWNWYNNWNNRPIVTQPTIPSLPRNPNPAPGNPRDNAPVGNLTPDEDYILKQVNAERAKAGLAPLQVDYRLVQTARAKSQDMIDHGYFDHQSPTLGSPFDQMKKAGISYRSAGENIAGNSSAAGAMTSWMNSPGHRANILNSGFTKIGIGVVNGGPYGKMLTQQFIG